MKLPFYKEMAIGIDARAKLYTAYLYISLFVVIGFSVIFLTNGYHTAALIQLTMVFPFAFAFNLAIQKRMILSKFIAVMTSITIVVIQTNYVFTPNSGFQYMLFPLLVIIYLINDLSLRNERNFTISFSLLITTVFFISANFQFSGPMILISETHQQLFFNISAFTSLVALAVLLYLYSLQLSTKEAALSFLAEYDALTQIYNRGYFTTNGHLRFEHFKEKSQPLSAIILDIDDFKRINDTYGHHVGDEVLIELARNVKMHLREDTIFSRYGGEEFAILLENMPLAATYNLAERLRKEIEQMCIYHDDTEIKFTVSLGVSTLHHDHVNFEDVMKDADRALYISKSKGKNKTWVSNEPVVAFSYE